MSTSTTGWILTWEWGDIVCCKGKDNLKFLGLGGRQQYFNMGVIVLLLKKCNIQSATLHICRCSNAVCGW